MFSDEFISIFPVKSKDIPPEFTEKFEDMVRTSFTYKIHFTNVNNFRCLLKQKILAQV